MGIDLNKDITVKLTFDSINFSIRKYVAGIRKQDPGKCWPFGSLGDPNNNEFFTSYESVESTDLSSENCLGDINCSDHTPEYTEAPKLSNTEIDNLKEDRSKTTTGIGNNMVKVIYDGLSGLTSRKINNGQRRHEISVNEGPKNRSVTADNNKPGRNRPIKKKQRFRLLSDIYKDLASELREGRDMTNPANVNKTFSTETEDDSNNEVTLDELFRKRKGVEVTNLTIKKKRTVRVEQRRVDQGKKSKCGFSEPRERGNMTNLENVNKTFTTETEGDLNDDVTLDQLFRKRKDVEVVNPTIKKKRTVRVEQRRVDQGKKSKFGFNETIGDDLEVGPGSYSRKKLRTTDIDTQTVAIHKNVRPSFSIVHTENKGAPLCPGSKENTFQKQKKLNRTEATETPNEDFEIEAVILLACHFNKEDSSASGKILHETDAGRACVQHKILEHLTPCGKKSIMKTSSTGTKSSVVSADVHKKFTKEKIESTFCSVQKDDDHSKVTTAAGLVPNAQKCETLVCSLNMNPADFSFPDDDNEFMRD